MKPIDRDRERSPRMRLGSALHDSAEEVAAVVVSRLTEGESREEGSPASELLETIALTDVDATRVLGRWVATGREASREEMDRLDALGMLVDRVPLPILVKAYLAWGDATTAVLEREAERVGAGEELTAEVRDMVARSCDASLVRMARKHEGERRRLQERLADEQDKLAHMALHDSLTGLANRRLLGERLEGALRSASRHGEAVAVCFVDLDDFKLVNDAHGHMAGDRVLQLLARRLQRVVRPSDTTARVGGDEFVVLCERLSGGAEEALALAERVLAAIREPCPVDADEVPVSASVGVAFGAAAGEGERLLARADAAMYLAKRRGGSACELYREDRLQPPALVGAERSRVEAPARGRPNLGFKGCDEPRVPDGS